ncbi:LLM class flavin-dependent oxidoreductase [Natrinema halophilum]|uniref:LLM class flavin-dependent oxidoreductase n=1 Tax=Natrinema halophilum TaxID=1699371 RepID=UPI001F2BCB96|nr:LLM class flavin-dependent oxidoreductase [Natrinema halophilum]UHQ96294.1 LLM class flavin-dependent oxidoreductase [Natrinema halophilum]
MEFGSVYMPFDIDETIEYAQYLEDSEYSTLWMADSHEVSAELYVALTACMCSTDDLQFAPGMTNLVTRHPSVTASAVKSLDEYGPGRVDVGVAAGDSAVFAVGETPTSVGELHEGISTIQTLLDGGDVTFNGQHFQFEQSHEDVDVYVAAEGPVTLRMAGEVADGIIFGGGTHPEIIEDLFLDNVAEGASNAGRSLDDIDLVVAAPTYVAESKDVAFEELRQSIEPLAAHNFQHSADEAPEEFREELRSIAENHDVSEHGKADAEAHEQISDEVLSYLGDRFAVAGTPAQCHERIETLEALGISQLVCWFPTDEPLKHTQTYHLEVIEPSTW